MTRRPKPTAHRVCGGIFTPDPNVPPDQNGRLTCRCALVGKAGDSHHTAPEPVEDVQSLAAGEKEETNGL